jgi:glycosidase
MSFATTILGTKRPDSVRAVPLPRRELSFPSPEDWRDEVIYFLLPDRFSDGKEATRLALDLSNLAAARPAGFAFKPWSDSGGGRYQGGSINGIRSKLDYIKNLGATTLWIGPIFKQRAYANDFHGYAIQDFLDVDPRLGTRQDLVDLVAAAHQRGMRVLLDVVFNHTADTWIYQNGQDQPPFLPFPQFYQKGQWRSGTGGLTTTIAGDDDGVHPRELQMDEYYTRAGEGDLGAGDINDPHAEFRRTDFDGDRKINYDGTAALDDVARCYKYWIALTDCDGLRLDTLKHVPPDVGRNFCGTIKEYAANLGKKNFFLVGEVAGADTDADYYLKIMGSNLDATLDIGEIRPTLTAVAKGLAPPNKYFDIVRLWDDALGSHRDSGKHRVSILDDHDCVSGPKVRFSTDASGDHQVVAGVAIQLFSLGIPCIYYGTEQAFAGPERALRDQFLSAEGFGTTDRFLREAMFGPVHPRKDGLAGIGAATTSIDTSLPGFGAFGTAGAHCFNSKSPAYIRIAALLTVRAHFPVLRYGRQYLRPISNLGAPFALAAAGELITWSRILDDEEMLCIVNGHGTQNRGGDVLVDASLNSATAPGLAPGTSAPFMQVVINTAQVATVTAGFLYTGVHPPGQKLPVLNVNGTTFVQIRDLPPAEVLILTNRP